MLEKVVTIKWRAGLHARPASSIVKAAGKFKSNIFIIKDDIKVDAKSIIRIMTLGAQYQTSITIVTEGEDESEALDTMVGIFEQGINEG